MGVPWRTTMRPFIPSSELSPEQRRRELAAILAAGILSLRRQRLLTGESARVPLEAFQESPAQSLEVSDKTVLSVHAG
ncbi:MAG: hypothetical protein Q8K78_12080 [Planctomycetaceae bacterium]|nr:hypothetical protein [Planctomycetaceae bacterium]